VKHLLLTFELAVLTGLTALLAIIPITGLYCYYGGLALITEGLLVLVLTLTPGMATTFRG
jgi:hypothetical protein